MNNSSPSIGDVADMASALEQDPTDGAYVECWSALARVVDDDPTYIFNEGDANGITVTCMVLTGPFVGAEVAAMVSCPLGGGFETRPLKPGMRVLLQFLEGRVDGLVVATATVPGGRENPIPTVVAGVAIDESGVDRGRLFAPPKGVGDREYYRGGIKVIRLKGLQDDFFSGFVVTADDGTAIELRWNGLDQEYLIEAKGKSGERLAVGSGFASLMSSDGNSCVQVSNDGVFIRGPNVTVHGDNCAQIDGGMVNIGLGLLPPTPANACAVGPAGPVNIISTKVFVGL